MANLKSAIVSVLLALSLVALYISCGKSSSSGGQQPTSPAISNNAPQAGTLNTKVDIDISQVNGFMLVPEKSATGLTSKTTINTLYSVGKNNSLKVVSVTSSPCEAGTSTDSKDNTETVASSSTTGTDSSSAICNSTSSATVYPVALFPTELYLFMAYVGVSCNSGTAPTSPGTSPTNNGPAGTLVALEKSSGNLYCVPGMEAFVTGIKNGTQFSGGLTALGTYYKQIQTDSTGKIVWINQFSGGPFRADFTDPAKPTVTLISSAGTANPISGGFAVNPNGDAFLGFGTNGNSGLPATVEHASGSGYDNVSIYQTGCVHVSTSQDNPNDFYYTGNITDAPTSYLVVAAADKNFKPAQTDQLLANFTPGWTCQQGLVQIGTHSFLTGTSNMVGITQNSFLDLVEGTKPVATVLHADALGAISQIRGAGDYVYILGTDLSGNALIVRYGPVSGTPVQTTVLGPDLTEGVNYTVRPNNFDVSSDGDITFQGTASNQKSGSTILVTIPAGSVYSSKDVISSTLPAISQIIRIN